MGGQPTGRLLLIGHWAPGAGLTRVLLQLARALTPEVGVRVLGLVPAGGGGRIEVPAGVAVHEVPQTGFRFHVPPELLRRHINDFRPEHVLVMGPAFMISPVAHALQPYRVITRILLYLSVEGELTSPIPLHLIDFADTLMLYTESARAGLMALAERAGRPQGQFAVLGHGVDTTAFRPVGRSASDIRRELLPSLPGGENILLVLNSNRAYRRKRLDLTIAGFAAFARKRPGRYLYLNVCGLGSRPRADLEAAITDSGVADRVLINALNPDGDPLPEESLNLLYNACEIGVTTAMGEGWGLGTFEHAATGAAQIVPGHTTFLENWDGAAIMLPPVSRAPVFYEYTDMLEISATDLADELTRLCEDRGLLTCMSQTAYARATEPRFGWDEIGRRLRTILRDPALQPLEAQHRYRTRP